MPLEQHLDDSGGMEVYVAWREFLIPSLMLGESIIIMSNIT